METHSHNHGDLLLVEFYHGAYGPTIRMDSRSVTTVVLARDVFLGLAQKGLDHVQLNELAWVKITNIKAFVLNRVPEGTEGLRTLRRIRGNDAELLFAWSREPEGWLECAEKLDPFVAHPSPGHQYLTLEGTDDALVEFTYREHSE